MQLKVQVLVQQNGSDYWADNIQYPVLQISPEVIFANEIQILDADFINPVKDSSEYLLPLKDDSALRTLRNIIAGWYVTLRTIAIVALLSVLIYVGIRIIISSASEDKAKYKQSLMDWIVAFCLLFFMHYIMAGIIAITDSVNDMLSANAGITEGLELNEKYGTVRYTGDSAISAGSSGGVDIMQDYLEGKGYTVNVETSVADPLVFYTLTAEKDGQTATWTGTFNSYSWEEAKWTNESGLTSEVKAGANDAFNGVQEISTTPVEGRDGIVTITTNSGEDLKIAKEGSASGDGTKILYFTNYARLYLNAKSSNEYLPMSTAYLIIYIALVTFTAVFALRYAKRVIYIAFLTLMAPVVAITYPIDKMKDRKSTSMGYVV